MTDDELLALAKKAIDQSDPYRPFECATTPSDIIALIERHRAEVERLRADWDSHRKQISGLTVETYELRGEIGRVAQDRDTAYEKLARKGAEVERLTRERDAWIETARQYCGNEEYYRGLVQRIGKTFGAAAYISDDGSVQQDVLCAKVPELAEAAESALATVTRERDEAYKLIYVPGLWECAKCGCNLVVTEMHADTGAMRASKEPQRCPNDCGPMWRKTERKAGNELADRLDAEITKREAAESALAAAQERVGVLQNVAGETLAALDKLDPLQAVLPVQQANLRAALAAVKKFGK